MSQHDNWNYITLYMNDSMLLFKDFRFPVYVCWCEGPVPGFRVSVVCCLVAGVRSLMPGSLGYSLWLLDYGASFICHPCATSRSGRAQGSSDGRSCYIVNKLLMIYINH